MTISTPPVNAGLMYVNGLNLEFATTTTLTVNQGLCRDSTNTNDIIVGLTPNVASTGTGEEPVTAGSGAVTINTAVNGAAGLDVGTLAASTFYAVYAIGDSYNLNAGSAMLSLSATQPTMPAGFNMFRRIGFVKTDGASHILPFRQVGITADRWFWWDAAIATNITSGSSATFASVDASGGIPPMGVVSDAKFLVTFTPTAASNALQLRPGLSSATNGYVQLSGSVGSVAVTDTVECPIDSPYTDAVDYLVVGSATAISVAAYLDQLEPALS